MQMVCIACIIAEGVKNVMFNNGNAVWKSTILYRQPTQSDIYLGEIFFWNSQNQPLQYLKVPYEMKIG